MAGWNGSGGFTRLYSWIADAAAGIDILASRVDADTNAITAQGFANCLTRDGQGSATALLPMNGFRHTGAAPGVATNDYATVGQLQPPGGSTVIPPGAYLGEIRETALPESLLGALMPGWHVCSGGTRPRTDPLWTATGAGNWVFGNGDGTTTYTLPDRRGRVPVGKDDMGGAAANRVTVGVSGVAGATLGGSGGDQHAQADTIATTLSGSLPASSASTSTSTVTDPTHSHNVVATHTLAGAGAGGGSPAFSDTTLTTNAAATGISVATATTTTTTVTNGLSASSTSALTGAAQNVQPALVENIVIFTGAV